MIKEIRKQRYIDKDYKRVNSIEEFINVLLFINEEDKSYLLKNQNEVENILNKYDIEYKNIYYINNGMMYDGYIVYVDDFIYTLNFLITSMEYMELLIKTLKDRINIKDYEKKFYYLPSVLRLDAFIKYGDKIKHCYNYKKLLIDTYITLDNDFSKIGYLVSKFMNKGEVSEEILLQDSIFIEDGYITIYRGENIYSTPIEESYSWTTSLKVAHFFSKRLGGDKARIYKAKVKVGNIFAYIVNRDEYEVLVNYSDIEDIKII